MIDDLKSADEVIALGFSTPKLIEGVGWCATQQMIATGGLFVAIDKYSYLKRYCYSSIGEAQEALSDWNGQGDPPGNWIKEKPSGRLGPGAAPTLGTPISELSGRPGHPGYDKFKSIAESWGYD